jgi:folate-dependent phosphoribosylglycinamide formyltransferase PurN
MTIDPDYSLEGFKLDREWFAFFSHTGAEIVKLSKILGVKPTKIITNKPPGSSDIDPGIAKMNVETVFVSNKPTQEDYERILNRCDDCICTLHGWMRIIPKGICKSYDIWNLHPGLITMYPELKGADPQWRVDQEKHDWIGLVIHKVTAGVDEGPVLLTSKVRNHYPNGDLIAEKLHAMAVSCWRDVFNWGFDK